MCVFNALLIHNRKTGIVYGEPFLCVHNRVHYELFTYTITPRCSKNRLKRQVVCETRVARTYPCKVNTFLLLEFEGEGIFRTVATIYTDILHLCCSKLVPSIHKPTTRYTCTLLWSHTQVHLHVRAKSGGRWSRSAGSRSPQRLFFTK